MTVITFIYILNDNYSIFSLEISFMLQHEMKKESTQISFGYQN